MQFRATLKGGRVLLHLLQFLIQLTQLSVHSLNLDAHLRQIAQRTKGRREVGTNLGARVIAVSDENVFWHSIGRRVKQTVEGIFHSLHVKRLDLWQ